MTLRWFAYGDAPASTATLGEGSTLPAALAPRGITVSLSLAL